MAYAPSASPRLRLRLRSAGIVAAFLVVMLGALPGLAQSSNAPAWRMDLVEQGLGGDEMLLAECVQGLMNRQGPGVYFTTYDYNAPNPTNSRVWLAYLTNEFGLVFTNAPNLRELIQAARNAGVINGLVRYNSTNLGGAEVQIAMTLAAQLNALPVTDQIISYQSPGLKNKGTTLCFSGLSVLQDIRGQWTNSYAAREWQVNNLLTNSSQCEAHCDGGHWFGPLAGPGCCESPFCGRDYAVMRNAFSFDFPFTQPAYTNLFNTVMAHLEAPAPLLGVWPAYGGGESENTTTPALSRSGNYWLLTHGALNVSFLAQLPVPASDVFLRKPSSAPVLDPQKYYVLFQTSEGDTIKQAWQMPGSAAWNDPSRGQIPIAWGVNPSLAERAPVFLQFLKTSAGAEDTFFAGPNGAGYTWLRFMSAPGRSALAALSQTYLETTGLQLVDIWGLDIPSLEEYRAAAPSVQGFTGERGPTNALLAAGTPLARCAADLWYGQQSMTNNAEVITRIQRVAASNPPPYFIVVYDGVDAIMEFAKRCATNLGPQFEIVGAEDFLALQRQRWFVPATDFQMLSNPGWDPSTVNGPDGGRNWTFSYQSQSSRANQVNDIYNAGRVPVTDGSKGFVKVQINGAVAGGYQFAASEWFGTVPGASWQASVYARPEFNNVRGGQLALLRLVFADAASNILSSASNVVLTSSSPDVYQLGTLTQSAPAGAALVRMEAGLFNPAAGNTNGYVLFDDASLATAAPYGPALLSPAATNGYPGQTLSFSAALPPMANQTRAVWVQVSNTAPEILRLPAALDNVVTLYYPAGTTNVRSFTGTLTSLGSGELRLSGPGFNATNSTFTAQAPEIMVSLQGTNLWVQWPTNLPGWQLRSATNLTQPVLWAPVTNSVVQNGAQQGVTLPASAARAFFRLEYP